MTFGMHVVRGMLCPLHCTHRCLIHVICPAAELWAEQIAGGIWVSLPGLLSHPLSETQQLPPFLSPAREPWALVLVTLEHGVSRRAARRSFALGRSSLGRKQCSSCLCCCHCSVAPHIPSRCYNCRHLLQHVVAIRMPARRQAYLLGQLSCQAQRALATMVHKLRAGNTLLVCGICCEGSWHRACRCRLLLLLAILGRQRSEPGLLRSMPQRWWMPRHSCHCCLPAGCCHAECRAAPDRQVKS